MQFNVGNKPEELLSSKNHHYMTESYSELYMRASVLRQTIPILCIDKNGALDIVVDHEYFISNKGTAHTFRSVLTSKYQQYINTLKITIYSVSHINKNP